MLVYNSELKYISILKVQLESNEILIHPKVKQNFSNVSVGISRTFQYFGISFSMSGQ